MTRWTRQSPHGSPRSRRGASPRDGNGRAELYPPARPARLVAAAVARRSGVDESLLDEVRLAVGEACSRAVEEHRLHCPTEPVRLALTEEAGRFEVEVTDNSTQGSGASGAGQFPPGV